MQPSPIPMGLRPLVKGSPVGAARRKRAATVRAGRGWTLATGPWRDRATSLQPAPPLILPSISTVHASDPQEDERWLLADPCDDDHCVLTIRLWTTSPPAPIVVCTG